MILDQIVKAKKVEVEKCKKMYPLSAVKEGLKNPAPSRNFKKAVGEAECAIIAEVKRKSPSKGTIRKKFDPLEISDIYENFCNFPSDICIFVLESLDQWFYSRFPNFNKGMLCC